MYHRSWLVLLQSTGAQHHANLCDTGMAAHQAGVGQAAIARHLQEWRAALSGAFSTDKHVYQTFGNGYQHGLLLPANTAHNCRHFPLQRPARPHTHHGRHVRHICLFRQRAGLRPP